MVQIGMFSDEWLSRYELLENLNIKLCDGNTDTDDRGDCNSSPCTSYRRAKKDQIKNNREKVETPFSPL